MEEKLLYKIYLTEAKYFGILIIAILITALCFNLNASAFIRYDSSQSQITKTYGTDSVPVIFQKLFGNGNNKYYAEFKKTAAELEKKQQTYNNADFPYKKLLDEIITGNKRVDIGSAFINDVITNNNRLDYYDLYIKLAKQKGYIVTSYYDYLTNYKDTDKKVLILRHDIDIVNDATKYMMEIEKSNNVKATYYFRWSTFNKPLIEEIYKEGFEIGLHYETLALYCIKNNKYTIGPSDIEKCKVLLKEEIIKFKQETGIDIKTIASHGNPVNKKIGIPNYVILLGEKYSDFGIIGETYDENIIRNYIKSYICDGELIKNDGFSYETNPIQSILANDRVIEFLSHPNHWNYDMYKRSHLYIEEKNGIIFN